MHARRGRKRRAGLRLRGPEGRRRRRPRVRNGLVDRAWRRHGSGRRRQRAGLAGAARLPLHGHAQRLKEHCARHRGPRGAARHVAQRKRHVRQGLGDTHRRRVRRRRGDRSRAARRRRLGAHAAPGDGRERPHRPVRGRQRHRHARVRVHCDRRRLFARPELYVGRRPLARAQGARRRVRQPRKGSRPARPGLAGLARRPKEHCGTHRADRRRRGRKLLRHLPKGGPDGWHPGAVLGKGARRRRARRRRPVHRARRGPPRRPGPRQLLVRQRGPRALVLVPRAPRRFKGRARLCGQRGPATKRRADPRGGTARKPDPARAGIARLARLGRHRAAAQRGARDRPAAQPHRRRQRRA